MKLFIPALGTRLRLTKPLTFALHNEFRNRKFAEFMGVQDALETAKSKLVEDYRAEKITYAELCNAVIKSDIEIPAGTVLAIDRIFIRKGIGDYDSLTFRALKGESDLFAKQGHRFWMKLADANRIECEVIS